MCQSICYGCKANQPIGNELNGVHLEGILKGRLHPRGEGGWSKADTNNCYEKGP